MKKIIILGTTASSMTGFRLPLIKALLSQNILVYCMANSFDSSQTLTLKAMGAIPVEYPVNRTGFNPFQDISNSYKLYKIIKSIEADTILSYFVKPVVYGTIAAFFAKIPNRFAMIEGLGYFFTEQPTKISKKVQIIKWIQIGLYKISLPLAKGLILLNHDDYNDLIKKYNIKTKNTLIIPGIGLTLDEFPFMPINAQPHPPTFLFIGRLLKEKGIFEFIEAAKIVKQQYPNTVFRIAGSLDSENPGSLSATDIDELNSQGLIQYLGQVDNIPEVISTSDVFVLPSYREGMPRSTQEAMAIGRPVITTDVPGCRESIINDKHGFIVPKWSAVAIAEKMVQLIKHPNLIEEMGKEANLYAQQSYDCKKTNEKIFQFFNN